MNPRTPLKYLSDIPITNGLGLSGAFDEPLWPRYIRTTDIATERSLRQDVFASQPPETARHAKVVQGDILMTAAGATIGKSYLHNSEVAACYAGYLVRFRSNRLCDNRFMSYWMQSTDYWVQIEKGAVRSTIDNFSAGRYRHLSVPTPNLIEQRRIAAFLDDQVARIDQAIALRERQIRLGESRYRSYVEQELGSITKRFPLRRVLADACVGIVIQPAALYVEESDPGVPALRGIDIREGWIDTSAPVRISEAGNLANRRSQLRNGDVVVVRTGVSGTCAVVDPEVAGWNCIDVVIARPTDELLGGFLEIVLNHAVSRHVITAASSGSIQGHFGVGALKELNVPLAAVTDQERLTTKIRAVRQRVLWLRESMQSQIGLLQERKRSLITAAVTGEFDVSSASGRALAGVTS